MDKFRSEAPVSVIIPCYTCAATIERAVVSVAGQTWRPAEVIVVDDASPDGNGTKAVLEELARQHVPGWVKIIRRQVNGGSGAARNTGWEAATQPYIAFLDADDSWHPLKIEVQLGIMQNRPEFDFSAHRYQIVAAERAAGELAAHTEARLRLVAARALLLRNFIATSTVMLKRELALRFPPKRCSEDYMLWLSLVLDGYSGAFIEAELAYRHKPAYGAAGLSARLWQMERGELGTYWELYREGKIPALWTAGLVPYSLAKFARRWLISTVRGGFHGRRS